MKRYRRYAAFLLCGALMFGGCGSDAAWKPDAPESTGAERETETQTDAEQGSGLPAETESGSETWTETETQEAVPKPLVQTVTVTAVGDCTLGATQTHGYEGSFHEYYDRYGADYFLAGVRDIFTADDFTLVNLECVLTDSTARVDKQWNLKGKPEYVSIMTGSSVEGCSLGNNHTQDYGPQSLADTRDVLKDAGIAYGYNDHVELFTTEEGIVIGIVSVSFLSGDPVRARYMREGIESLRAQGAQLVIASCHWGEEGTHSANSAQRSMAHQVVDWGADLVVGTHPHVLQGLELYNGKVICYSLGNFCFGGNRNPADKDTAIYRQTFTFVDGVLQPDVNADMIPCRLSSVPDRNDFQPTVCGGEQKTAIIGKLNEYSAGYSDICLDGDGKLMLKESD